MARTRSAMNEEQQALVDRVTRLNIMARTRKRELMEQARAEVAKQVADLLAEHDQAVLDAVEHGVPLAEFRRKEHGLHTTNPATVLDALARAKSAKETSDHDLRK